MLACATVASPGRDVEASAKSTLSTAVKLVKQYATLYR
jgi:hypothetical protein